MTQRTWGFCNSDSRYNEKSKNPKHKHGWCVIYTVSQAKNKL